MVLYPPSNRFVSTVTGVAAAQAVADAALAANQIVIPGPIGNINTTAPGNDYPYVFIRDYVYSSDTYSTFFTSAYIRPTLDTFAATVGGDTLSTDSPAEHISQAGVVMWRGGATPPGFGRLASFDSGPFFVLLAAQAYERGDTAVYAEYKDLFERVLLSTPQDEYGRCYSAPGGYSVGWGFEDTITSSNKGATGMATAYHALAYRKLASMATAEGDTASASRFLTQHEVFVGGLASLRRPDGYYYPSTTDPAAHVILTAMVVFYGLASSAEITASCNALLADYNAAGPNFGFGGPGGNVAQRGGVRHIRYPDFFSETGTGQGIYHNGGAWPGPWTGWLAYALSLVDPTKGQELLQSAVDEIAAEPTGPLEWYNSMPVNMPPPVQGSARYPSAAGFLPATDVASVGSVATALVSATAPSLNTVAVEFTVLPDLPTTATVTVNGENFAVIDARIYRNQVIYTVSQTMPSGTGTVTIDSTVTAYGVPATPGSVTFRVTPVVTLAAPAPDAALAPTTAYSVLRQSTPRTFGGKEWESLLWVLAAGDQKNYDNAKAAFEQAFLHTATSQYLDQRGAERGILRLDTFMSDERFRAFIEALDLERVNEHSIWKLLEVLYGSRMTRACAISDGEAYPLLGGESFLFTMDGNKTFTLALSAADWTKPGAVPADEVAAAINRAMRAVNYKGWAETVVLPTGTELRVYSERLGFSGSVVVSGDYGLGRLAGANSTKKYVLERYSGSSPLFASVLYDGSVLKVRVPNLPIIDAPSGDLGDGVLLGDASLPNPDSLSKKIAETLDGVVAVGNDYDLHMVRPRRDLVRGVHKRAVLK